VKSLENLEPRVESVLKLCQEKQGEKCEDAEALTEWINETTSEVLHDADHDVKDAQRRINSVKSKQKKAETEAKAEAGADHSEEEHSDVDLED
ncbi:unnamed protein product, partial [Symbiodinium necroappetens]